MPKATSREVAGRGLSVRGGVYFHFVESACTTLCVTAFALLLLPAPIRAAVVDVTCKNASTDTSTLNSAISTSSVGDRISIHGTCLVNQTIVLRPDRTYEGDSRTGTIIRQVDGSNLDALVASDSWMSGYAWPDSTSAPVRVAHLTLDGNRARNSKTNALVIRSWLTVIEDLEIENAPADGLQITNLNQSGVALTTSQVNGRISNCFITNSGGNGIHIVDTGNAVTDWDLLDSWIADSGQSAIMMDNAAGWKIRGNHLYGVPANAIFADRCWATAIEDNYIEDFGHLGGNGNTFYGIACTVGGDAGTVISGNKVFQVDVHGGDAPTGTLIYIGIPRVNYGIGVVNIVNNLINGGKGPNTIGLLCQVGNGTGLQLLSEGNNVQSVATAQEVGPGITLLGQSPRRIPLK